ncbi:MAG: hypothetical protein EPN55_05815 [Gammaproteobacteria bacterium]|nr:MAG: hypothetical protein EPN55_05815 [Gammaproteobacteria bacterium]
MARKIKKKEYEHERKHVVRFLRLHSAHGAVNAAYELAGLWLREAEAGQPVPAQEQMARLAAGGVTGAEIIEEVLALWLYSRWHPTGLPDDIRLTKALGTNVLLLVPREASSELTPGGEKKYRRLGALIRAEVGEHIRRVFGVFALNVLTAIERQIRAKQDAAQALRTPFPDPLSTPTAPPEGDAGPH